MTGPESSLEAKPGADDGFVNPVVDGKAAHLESARRRDHDKNGAVLQQMASDVRAETQGQFLPQVTGVDVGGILTDFTLELEVVHVTLLLVHAQQVVTAYQDVGLFLPFQAIENEGQQFRQSADLWKAIQKKQHDIASGVV